MPFVLGLYMILFTKAAEEKRLHDLYGKRICGLLQKGEPMYSAVKEGKEKYIMERFLREGERKGDTKEW